MPCPRLHAFLFGAGFLLIRYGVRSDVITSQDLVRIFVSEAKQKVHKVNCSCKEAGLGPAVLHYNITLWYNVARAILLIMKSESTKLGNNMKRIRTKKGISQGDIARTLGLGRGYISNIENGKTNPTLSTIANLAKALGVQIEDLIK